jgi:hypothetical protein
MTVYILRVMGYFGFVLHSAFPTKWSIWESEAASATYGRDAKHQVCCVHHKGLLSATGQRNQFDISTSDDRNIHVYRGYSHILQHSAHLQQSLLI